MRRQVHACTGAIPVIYPYLPIDAHCVEILGFYLLQIFALYPEERLLIEAILGEPANSSMHLSGRIW
jgi:hypothetical protein